MRKAFNYTLYGALLLLLVGSLSACRVKQQAQPSGVSTLAVVGLNDIHANIDQLPRIAFMVDSMRAIYPNLLLLAAGDLQTGNPINDNFQPKGLPIIELMNEMRFDASALGNHEFDLGQHGLGDISHRAKFPFLSANVFPSPSYGIALKPYKIFTMPDGTRVSVVGLLQLSKLGIPESHPKNVRGVAFTKPLEEVKNYRYLAGCSDLQIAVTHIGVQEDTILARVAPYLDLIVGGHSHTLIDHPNNLHSSVPIVQSGYKAHYISLALIRHRGGQVLSHQEMLLPADPRAGGVNEKMQRMVEGYNANPLFAQVVTTNPKPIQDKYTLGAIFADAQRWYSHADFAMQNPGGVRIGELPQGNITLKDILRLDPFGNELTVLTMTGRQLKEFFLRAWTTDSNTPAHTSGLRVDYQLDDTGVLLDCTVYPAGSDTPIDPDKLYTLATSSYVQAAYTYQTSAPDKNQGITTAEVIVQYLKSLPEMPQVDYKSRYNIRVTR